MDFIKEINDYESNLGKSLYIEKNGVVPIILTSVHAVEQTSESGLKLAESYTAAICQYVGDKMETSCLVKAVDNGVNSNLIVADEFKELLLKKIKDNDIKMLIDIHGAKREREFDVEFGTLSNMSLDVTVQKTLVDCFAKNGIHNIALNDPFKGGGVTRYIYESTSIDIVQIEINSFFRDSNNINECQKVCNSLIDFAKIYMERC